MLDPGQPGAKKQPAEEHDKDRIGKQHQALKLGGDVNQPFKIQQRRDVIADETGEKGADGQAPAGQRFSGLAELIHGIKPDADKEGQGGGHAQRQHQGGVGFLHIGELDENGLG